MSKEAGEKKVIRVGLKEEDSGFLKMLSVLAGARAAGRGTSFPGAISGKSKMGRYNKDTRGAFGSPCGSKMRLGGYKIKIVFNRRAGLVYPGMGRQTNGSKG